jgi:hypothetical protein
MSQRKVTQTEREQIFMKKCRTNLAQIARTLVYRKPAQMAAEDEMKGCWFS